MDMPTFSRGGEPLYQWSVEPPGIQPVTPLDGYPLVDPSIIHSEHPDDPYRHLTAFAVAPPVLEIPPPIAISDASPTADPAVVSTPPERPVRFFTPVETRARFQAIAAPPTGAETINTALDAAREALLAQFPSETAGLAMGRVQRFMETAGLHGTTAMLVSQDRQAEFLQTVEKMTGDTQEPHLLGIHYEALDLVVVFRDPITEQQNGPEFSEAALVHELTHSSARHRTIMSVVEGADLSLTQPRRGLVTQPFDAANPRGTFLEEGVCERRRSQYIAETLNRPRGFSNAPRETMTIAASDGARLPIPTKYVYVGEHGGPVMLDVSYTGAAMDLLVAHDPPLDEALIEARRSVAGLREVARRLNTIQPGLYRTLRDNFNSEDTFQRGYRYVLDVLGTRA